jgi:hypothetical protein
VAWYVEAIFEGACKRTASTRFEFKVGEAECPTGVPSLLSPANGATGVPSPVKFSWTTVDGAISYELFVSQNGEPFLSGGTTEGTTLSKALTGTVAWYVEAVFPGKCERGRSAKREFKVTEACPTGAPKLLAPANGATDVVSPVQFTWSAVDGAVEYEVFARVDGATFTSLGTTTSTSLTRSLSGGVAWYVEAIFSGKCERGRSATFEFKVAESTCPREGPALGTPGEGAAVESPVIFTWTAVPGALKYALGIRPAGSGDPFKEITTTTTNAEVKLSAGEFEWQVVAYPDRCDAVKSSTRRFAVKESSTCETNRPVELVFPSDGETFKTEVVKFVWTIVEGASLYDLQVSLDGGGTWKTLGSTREEGIVVTVPRGKVAWRVLAQFDGCPPLPSQPRSIEVIVETCSSEQPSIIAPPLEATVTSPVSLEWSSVPGADYYRVFGSVDGNAMANISGSVTGTSYEAALPSGKIVWYVEAVSRACGSTFSDKSVFVVEKRGTCPTAGPELVSPPNGASGVDRTVAFSWQAVAGAVAYEVFVSIDGGAPASLGQTKDIAFAREMKGEKIVWFVHAITPGCEPVPSLRWSFGLAPDDACAIAAPSRLVPVDGSSGISPVEFQWTSSGTGTYYRLWIARDGEREVVLAETLDTAVKRHLEPGSYTWFVEAFRKGCRLTSKSTKGRFAVVESQSCTQDAPVPLTPSDGATLTSPEVIFNWSPVEGAVAYELWLSRGDGVETLVQVTRETFATMVLDEGKLLWFVRALFDGCRATRSQGSTFVIDLPDTCKGQPPFLLSPPIDEMAELSNPVFFSWTPATGGSGSVTYTVFASVDDSEPITIGETTATSLLADLPPGRMTWFVRGDRPGCPPLNSSRGVFVVADPELCSEPPPPAVRAVLEAKSGVPYDIAWLPGPNSGSFIVEESTDEQFGVVESKVVAEPFTSFVHDVEAPTRFFYRVFAISDCDESTSLPSETVRVIVTPRQKSSSSKVDDVHPIGTAGQVSIPILVPGSSGKTTAETTFTASMTQPWMSVSPSSGTIPPEGITLTVTADMTQLDPGANTAGLVLTTSEATGKTVSDGSTTTPVSVSLVSPVTQTSKSGPKPESLIIPAVGHAAGLNSQWQSDVRLSNISAQAANYLLFFTPSGQAGTSTVKQASVTVNAGSTVALDDVVKSWFGIGADGSSATGTLEVRPQSNAITTTSNSSMANGTSLAAGTVASSRTYNLSTTGTFGQFIPAVAFASFAGKGEPLSLQQVSQSSQFRTNIGVAEGAGENATVQFSVITNDGQTLDQWTEDLQPGEQRQYDQVIAQRGLTLEGGRVEVEVVSDTGKVTAYASTVDNQTGDPTFVTPVKRKAVEAKSKLVVPGVADLDNGVASWRTDVRLYNAGDASESVTLSYYEQGQSAPSATKQFTIEPGGVLEANDLLKSTFGITNSGGALHIETDGSANLVPTARTYNRTESGTYGQFIPAVSADKGARLGSTPIQLLQVEQSAAFRTNLGLAELSGDQVTVEVTAAVPGGLTAPIKQYTLGANEFRQVGVILNDMGIPEAYNARISIRVVDGGGSVSAYASVVDNSTQDPTYVPAQ